MNDLLTLPSVWRDELATVPLEIVFTVIAAVTFALLLLLATQTRLFLRIALSCLVVVIGVGAGTFGSRAGDWADSNNKQSTVIVAGLIALALVFALRLRGTLKTYWSHRRLVNDVKHDPQRLLVLALASEISEKARNRAVKLLEDPFALDEVARRSRSRGVKRLAKKRLLHVRTRDAQNRHGDLSGTSTPERSADKDTPKIAAEDAGHELLPESFYLPPEKH